MFSVHPPFFFRFFNPRYLSCSIPGSEKVIYLTFDDGPVPEITPVLLKILEDRQVLATFFCLGENVMKNPDLFQQVVSAGHSVGNHSYNHLNGWKTPPGEYAEDVLRCNDYIKTNLFRPPYGKFTPSQYFLLRKHYRFIMWSVLSGDYNRKITPEKCLSNVLNFTKPGSIVVFHDSIKASEKLVYALPRFLDHFLEKGCQFEGL